MRSRLRAAGLVLAVLLLPACAGIPTSGPVQQGGDLQAAPRDDGVPFIAEPPSPGASPEDVVAGFLRAGADFRSDHRVARLYLSPRARTTWRPGSGTTVYDRTAQPLTIETADGGSVIARGRQVARIDAEGSYRRTPPETSVERSFGMERVDGQWRIASLDDGLLLSSVDVNETYRQLALYFLTPSRTTLVPDLVLLPQLPGLSTKLVTRLLRGPTRALRGAVLTSFPQGSTLEVQSVPVDNGLATVALDATALKADDAAREQMSAQLVWTLKQLGPEVGRVRITAGGEDLVTSGVAPAQPRDSWATYAPDVLTGEAPLHALRPGGGLGRLVDGELVPVAGAAGTAVGVRTPAVSPDADRVAVVSADGRQLLVGPLGGEGALTPVATGGDLARPSFDPAGNVWYVDRALGQLRMAPVEGGGSVAVALPEEVVGLSGLALSRDGTRVVLLVGTGEQARALVGSLTGIDQLDGADTPDGVLAVTAVAELLPGLTAVRDVGWADATRVVLLGVREPLPLQPVYATTDGFTLQEVEPQAQMVAVAAAPVPNPLFGSTDKGRLLQFNFGRGWVPAAPGASPRYPG